MDSATRSDGPAPPPEGAHGEPARRRTYLVLVLLSFAVTGFCYAFGQTFRMVLTPEAYVPLHVLLEILAVVVSFAVFAVHWHASTRPDLVDRRALFVGAAFLAIASLDVIHTMSYRGMPGIFGVGANPDRAIHYWLAARFVLVGSLLAAPLVPRQTRHRLFSRPILLAGAAALVGLVVATDLAWVRPGVYFVDGQGLTPLKIGLETATAVLAAVGCIVTFRRARRAKHPGPFALALPAALAITVAVGLCFTLYTSVNDTFNLLGHVLKVVASYLIFDALFVSALLRPWSELDAKKRDLAASNRELESLRRHVEGELADTIDRLERSTEAERVAKERAEATAGRLAALQRVADATLAPADLDTLLGDILVRLCEVLHADMATVHLLGQDGVHLEPRAAYGLEEEVEIGLRIPMGQGIAGEIACTRKALVVDDLGRREVESPALRRKARSLLGAPLILDDRVIGVIKVATAAPRHFTEDDLTFLRLAADRAAGAIDRTRLHAELEATLASIPDPLIVYDARGEIKRINCPAMRILQYSPEDYARPAARRWAGLRIADPDGRVLRPEETPMARALRGEMVQGEVLQIEPRPGQVHWVSASAGPIAGPGGRPVGAVLSFPDVTAVRELEAHREDLLRTVSHDLRSPLAALRLQAQRLRRSLEKIETPEGTLRGLDSIVRAADRMGRMIEDLVDSERLSAGKIAIEARPVELATQLRELVGSTGGIDASRLDLELPPELPPVLGDPARIDRILTNLLTNAFKYSPPSERVRVGASARDGEVELWVSDRGQGIAPEDQAKLFTRYYRTANAGGEGLGLGLYITRMLVEAHGGRISVDSRPGAGSTFRFTLPRAARPAAGYGSASKAEG
jgi:signal transduction histidine kinase